MSRRDSTHHRLRGNITFVQPWTPRLQRSFPRRVDRSFQPQLRPQLRLRHLRPIVGTESSKRRVSTPLARTSSADGARIPSGPEDEVKRGHLGMVGHVANPPVPLPPTITSPLELSGRSEHVVSVVIYYRWDTSRVSPKLDPSNMGRQYSVRVASDASNPRVFSATNRQVLSTSI